MKRETKKTKFRLTSLFRLKPSPVKEEDDTRINLSVLRKLVTTKEHENILKLIENETIPSVKAAWIDYFLEKTKSSKYKKSG